jgi:hypothetical protein
MRSSRRGEARPAFDVRERQAAGSTSAPLWSITAFDPTLEAYLAIIETARSHVYAVNGFPLMLEIQHALLRALRRGVRVCALLGHLTPRHGGRAFRGPWARVRTAATELVHSRVDALVAAGGGGTSRRPGSPAGRLGWRRQPPRPRQVMS